MDSRQVIVRDTQLKAMNHFTYQCNSSHKQLSSMRLSQCGDVTRFMNLELGAPNLKNHLFEILH